mmetsp:Transcript_12214/g.26711  ORF Transcript_12214/g.26711 Transcript_12214/m.26711 type:complete len:204 (+) Transcript_12214:266-877(+)
MPLHQNLRSNKGKRQRRPIMLRKADTRNAADAEIARKVPNEEGRLRINTERKRRPAVGAGVEAKVKAEGGVLIVQKTGRGATEAGAGAGATRNALGERVLPGTVGEADRHSESTEVLAGGEEVRAEEGGRIVGGAAPADHESPEDRKVAGRTDPGVRPPKSQRERARTPCVQVPRETPLLKRPHRPRPTTRRRCRRRRPCRIR